MARKTLISILLGAGLISNILFNSSCNYKKPPKQETQEIINPEFAKIDSINNYAYELRNKNPAKSLEILDSIAERANEIDYEKGYSGALVRKGDINKNLGNYELAKRDFLKFLEIKKEKNDSLGIADGLSNLGMIFATQGDYNNAVKNYTNALKIYDRFSDSLFVSKTYNRLGIAFGAQGKYNEALEYFDKSLDINKALNDSLEVSQVLNNIGTILDKQNKNEQALLFYFGSLKIADKINNKTQESFCLNNIADSYRKTGELSKSFDYLQKSIKIGEELGDKRSLALNFINIGEIYLKNKDPLGALPYLNKSLALAEEINAPDLMKDIYQTFSETYEAKGEFGSALKYFKRYSLTKDFLLNSESLKQVAELETKYQSEKKELENKSLKKDNEIKETKNEKQKWGLWGLAGILGLSGALAYSLYRGRKLIKEKNENITASIRYASLIQKAILPENEKIKKLLPESFIFYKPKDIVSGDFYWMAEKNNKVYFSACDCTGHGVPGAFMHMTLNTLLNEAVAQKNILKPNEIFNDVRKNIISSLKSTSGIGERKDGMDSILCAWDSSQNTLEFACANNPLYLIRNNELIEFKADRMPVGYSDNLDSFTLKNVELEKNDLIYISSDGYQDQFGGQLGKKFMRKNLKELLLSIHEKPMQEQKEILEDKIKNWKGALEQCDDLLVIGVRV